MRPKHERTTSIAKIRKLEQQIRKEALDAGLDLEMDVRVVDRVEEKLQLEMQTHLAEAKKEIEGAIESARQLGLTTFEFLGSYVQWQIGGEEAVGGPIITEDVWTASSFECYPSTKMRTWLRGSED